MIARGIRVMSVLGWMSKTLCLETCDYEVQWVGSKVGDGGSGGAGDGMAEGWESGGGCGRGMVDEGGRGLGFDVVDGEGILAVC